MNKNINIRRLTTMAVMAALSVVLVFLVHFPLFAAAPFLEYDPADVPILITALAFGPLAGLAVTLVAAVVQGVTVSANSGFYGILMHVFSTGSFVLTAGIIYKLKHNRTGAIVAIISGVLVSAGVMALANLLVVPVFMKVPVEVVKGMLVPIIIPFNLLKSGINGAITFVVYKSVSRFIKQLSNAD